MAIGDTIHSHAASVFRGWRGVFAKSGLRQREPEQHLELYEFES